MYAWKPDLLARALEASPHLKSPLSPEILSRPTIPRSCAIPVSEWWIALSSGPGNHEERLKYAKDTLERMGRPEHNDSSCGLIPDSRGQTAAFYSIVTAKTEMLKLLLNYEKDW